MTNIIKFSLVSAASFLTFSTCNQAVAQDAAKQSADTEAGASSRTETTQGGENSLPPALGAPLWRGFTVGLNATAVVDQLQRFPEISEAKVKIKNGKPPEIKLKYNSKFSLFGFQFTPNFQFNENGLNSIILNSVADCAGERFQDNLNKIMFGLSEKYPQTLRVVNDLGSELKNQAGYTDGSTEIILTVNYYQPPSAYEVAKAKLDASLASLEKSYNATTKNTNASIMEIRRNSAIRSCPSSEGHTTNLNLYYYSRFDRLNNKIRSDKIKEEKQERDIDGI